MTRRLMLACLPLLAGACGPSPDNNAAPEIAAVSDEQKALRQMNDLYRAIALKRAIHQSHYVCGRIEQSQYVGRYKNMDMYSARCNDSKDWALFIGGNNDVQVRRCADTQKVGLPACRFDADTKKPAEKGSAG